MSAAGSALRVKAARLRDTQGKYARLARLSDRMGIETRVLQARWHRIRSGQVLAPEAGSGPLADLLADSSPQAARILRLIYDCPGLSVADLGERLGIDAAIINGQIAYNEARLAQFGFMLRRARGVGRGMLFHLEPLSQARAEPDPERVAAALAPRLSALFRYLQTRGATRTDVLADAFSRAPGGIAAWMCRLEAQIVPFGWCVLREKRGRMMVYDVRGPA